MWQFIHCSGPEHHKQWEEHGSQYSDISQSNVFLSDRLFGHFNSLKACIYLLFNFNIQPQIRKSWDSMENANKKESSDF